MDTCGSYRRLLGHAGGLRVAGQLADAIRAYRAVVDRIFASATASANAVRSDCLRYLEQATSALLELYRWGGQPDEAIALLDRLASFAPSLAERYAPDRASFLIARGDVDDGLARLEQLAAIQPDSALLLSVLGSECYGLGRLAEAERHFLDATQLAEAAPKETAEAYRLLFELYWRCGDVVRAEEAWLSACKCDPTHEALRPRVCRMMIEERHFDRAHAYIAREPNETRRLFSAGLVELTGGYYGNALAAMRRIAEGGVAGIAEAPDEFAEACLYANRPNRALEVLRPFVARGEIDYWRVMLVGLAYALAVDIPHANQYLDVALRLADSSVPRQTRPGRGEQRILSGRARVAYGDIITATDLREELDHYFIPARPPKAVATA